MLPLDKYLVFLSIVLHTFLPIRLALVTCALVVTLLVSRAQRRMRAVKRKSQKLRVCFLHPDLGIGGAERLVVDAAVAAQRRGHAVTIYTAHHDEARCFAETRDGTLAVRLAGGWLPRSIGGRLHILCATLRGVAGGAALLWCEPECDVAVVDQVSAPVPLLRLLGLPTLFYCHFPDKLLAQKSSALRAAYRLPFDLYEELSTGCASRVLVNSAFTASVYGAAFPLLRGVRGMLGDDEPDVLHPAIDPTRNPLLPPTARRDDAPLTLVSINRFERKKNLRLAIEALALARGGGGGGGGGGANLELVLAGGWDARLAENVEYFAELQQAAADLGVADAVRFERNVSDEERGALLAAASAVVYTPSLEHFGIVPLEAMAAGRPVVAVDDGGPKETVKHGATGWLCAAEPAAFAAAFASVAAKEKSGELRRMGEAARAHVTKSFSLDAFGEKLEGHLLAVARNKQ